MKKLKTVRTPALNKDQLAHKFLKGMSALMLKLLTILKIFNNFSKL